jgi:hypothetical protein
MRRLAVLAPLAVLAVVLLVRSRRRRRLDAPPEPPPAPAALPEGPRFVSAPWRLTTEASEDRAELSIRYRGGEHMELDRIDVQETPTQVFVTVLMRWRPPAGGRLAWDREHDATAPLSRPLGARELLHAPVDEPTGPPVYP